MPLLSYVPVLILTAAIMMGIARGPWPWPGEVVYGTDAVPRVHGQTEVSAPLDNEDYTRSTVTFDCGTDLCEGWLYAPKPVQKKDAAEDAPETTQDEGADEDNGIEKEDVDKDSPQTSQGDDADEDRGSGCVIMAHGLGGQKDMGLHQYAHEFVTSGFSVLVFDYRSFGGSDGDLRHYISPPRLLEDWESALKEMKGPGFGGQVTCNRMYLWGTSYSGGHVLVLASRHPNDITAVVSQVPFLSPKAASKTSLEMRGILGSVKMVLAGLHDWIRSKMGLEPAYIKLVGKQGELAFMTLSDDQMASYFAKHPKVLLGGWKPYVLARLVLEMMAYSPMNYLKRDILQTPVLMISCSQDHLCNPDVVREAFSTLGPASELLEYSCHHFDIYGGELFRNATQQMVSFFQKHGETVTG